MPGLDLDTIRPDQVDGFIESVAGRIRRRGLEAPAVLFLEMHRPLSFLAGQSVMVAMPLLAPLIGVDNVGILGKVLMERENVEKLIARIENRND